MPHVVADGSGSLLVRICRTCAVGLGCRSLLCAEEGDVRAHVLVLLFTPGSNIALAHLQPHSLLGA